MKTTSIIRLGALALLTLGCTLAPLRASSAEPADAKQILAATGVKGGLIVHVGCGDGTLTTALRASDSFLVHGLDPAAKNVQAARARIQSLGLAGKVAVAQWSGPRLPYVDNLVNLLVVSGECAVPKDELLRVLAPNGVAFFINPPSALRTPPLQKPRSKDLDEWTHYLHDAGGNAVAHDLTIGPPRHMQWLAEPDYSRNHDKLASISSVVSANGRIFCIVDEAPPAATQIPGRWHLVARDAFNGTLLWDKRMDSWAWHEQKFRAGPVQLPRTLVTDGDHVYAPLGLGEAVSCLDAATGERLRTYKETVSAEEVILANGTLLVVTGSPGPEQAGIGPGKAAVPFPNVKTIHALRADTGAALWQWTRGGADGIMPLTLASDGKRAFFEAGHGVICLDGDTGKVLWDASNAAAGAAPKSNPGGKAAKKGGKQRGESDDASGGPRSTGWSVATLVVQDGVVLLADGKILRAWSADNGKALWNGPCQAGFRSPTDLFVINGLVWLGPDFSEGRDLRSGVIKKRSTVQDALETVGHHHRCYREKATDRYILDSYRGIEFLDVTGDGNSRNNWVRGVCQYGIMPCNGLIYAPSHACGCFMEAKLNGFWALAPERKTALPAEATPQLEQGPAYAEIRTPNSALRISDEWPTLRHDALRSGSTTAPLPAQLADLWQTKAGGHLSAPVVAEGVVLVSDIDASRVVAIDAGDGKLRWSYLTGGRVDSPPTIWNGLALFGSADGWVYAVRLTDGQIAWRFRAAPQELFSVAFDQVESVWPVSGSVLVESGVAYFSAGRDSYLDDGIMLYGLDPKTGKILSQSRVRTEHPKGTEGAIGSHSLESWAQNATDNKTFAAPDKSDAFSMEGTRNEVLVSDGQSIFLHHLRFDRQCVRQEKLSRHLFSTTSLLDDDEYHRSHWVLGTGDFSRLPVAYPWIADSAAGKYGSRLFVPYGLMLSYDDNTVWGVSHLKGYSLFAEANKAFSASEPSLPDFRKQDAPNAPARTWSVELGLRPRAIVRAGGTLLLGGMPATGAGEDAFATYEGRKTGLLCLMAAQNGATLAEHKLPSPPVWDGMAAAKGRLYVATVDGRVLCVGQTK